MKKIKLAFISTIALSLLSFGVASAAITSQLQLGASGSDVTQLQQFLATDASIYPSGLVTGYFGPLTQAAVVRFQAAHGLAQVGRVGPMTLALINSLMGGSTPNVSWDPVPFLSTPNVQVTTNSATVSFTTNEATQGQVYYNTVPLQADEATGPQQQPYVSGFLVTDGSALNGSHLMTISNLQANTVYYFLTRAIDSGGNMSMTWPSTFKTN